MLAGCTSRTASHAIAATQSLTVREMEGLLQLAGAGIGSGRLLINPDRGLKTRAWPETRAASRNLVEEARRRRAATAREGEAAAS